MKKVLSMSVVLLCISGGAALAQSDEAEKLSQRLIYSVNRTPERPFETSRAVEVITREEIWRKNATTLSEILKSEAGYLRYQTSAAASSPLLRGLLGKQVLVLIDGVKVNNALYGDTPNIDLIDVSQIERIEIVRGVVSVLGTESLGGVINIITRKGSPAEHGIGATAGLQYSSGTEGFSTPVQFHQQTAKFRWNAGVNMQQIGEMRGGEGAGTQRFTDYEQRAGHASFHYFLSPEKTVSLAYRSSQQEDVKTASGLINNTQIRNGTTPVTFTMATAAYQDVTDRGLWQSLRVTGYVNRQSTGTMEVRTATPDLETTLREDDSLRGLSLELGSFVGRHHFVYGVDLTDENVHSHGLNRTLSTGAETERRGRYTDDATYQTAGIYAQDHFSLTKWITASAGLRYGIFSTEGKETLPVVGEVVLDGSKSDVTGSLNVIFHATPHLNIIGNAMRGFRAPNLRDTSSFSQSSTSITIPAPDAEAERVMSYEGGVKYDRGMFSGSAFYFRNTLSNLLLAGTGTFNGLPFVDTNKNGVKDANEPSVRQNRNFGEAIIDGYELDVNVTPRPWITLYAVYSASDGRTEDVAATSLVQRVPPPLGTGGVKLTSSGRFSPWAELSYSFYRSFELNGTVLTPDTNELNLRAGFTPANWLRVALSGENLGDELYYPRFTTTAHAGRRVVLTTEFRF